MNTPQQHKETSPINLFTDILATAIFGCFVCAKIVMLTQASFRIPLAFVFAALAGGCGIGVLTLKLIARRKSKVDNYPV